LNANGAITPSLFKFIKDIVTGSSLQPILGNRGTGHIIYQLTQIPAILTPHQARRMQTETCQGYALGALEFKADITQVWKTMSQ
jgi:hypothetical protein